jgi:hemin uptake protein HemP
MDTPNSLRSSERLPASDHGRCFTGRSGKIVKVIPSSTLFSGAAEIGIEHHGELYRLKLTRQGKLILTK